MAFAGWNMPVQYRGIREEHEAVRTRVGIFDISHMGQFFVEGPAVGQWLDTVLTNHANALEPGRGQYTLMCNEKGGVIDDLIIYRTSADAFFLVVNASMIDTDLQWLQQHCPQDITLRDESVNWAGMAVQGPESAALYAKLFDGTEPPARNGIAEITSDGDTCLVCRTGYTGEDGFEFFCPAASGGKWWQRFLDGGAEPCGLGARDTLRLEASYPLNGNDLSPERTPIEAGLKFAVKFDKGDFIGRDVLAEQVENGPAVRLAGFKMTGKTAPPRAHYPVLHQGEVVGEIASGTLSPTLGEGIGMGYLPTALAAPGTPLEIDVRGRRFPAETVKKPFYKRGS